MTDQTTTAPVWQDGDPLMEAIAAAVYEHCEVQRGSGIVIDDPRNIAAAAVAGIRDAARQAAGQTDACHPAWYAGECPCPTSCGCCKVAPSAAAGQTTRHHIPCGQCGAPWSDGHGQPGDPCSAAGQAPTTEHPGAFVRTGLLHGLKPGGMTMTVQPARAVEQPAEAHPPRDRWRLEAWEDDRWIHPSAYSNSTREQAETRRAVWAQRRPDARTRLVRETTTWTVEETP